jgi:hypothetical protein
LSDQHVPTNTIPQPIIQAALTVFWPHASHAEDYQQNARHGDRERGEATFQGWPFTAS